MHDPSLTLSLPDLSAGRAARRGGSDWLANALRAGRADTLATFDVFARAAELPIVESLNPPLWELGHLGWFQEFWIARNPVRGDGHRADPQAARREGVRANADALYDSGRVAPSTRRSLPLPDAESTRADLSRQLDTTCELLAAARDDADALYFFRLALLHEDMHHEAALYAAQSLGLPVDDPRWQLRPLAGERSALMLDAVRWRVGAAQDGFVFDNELGAHAVDLPATRIDARVLSWADYLPFADAGGYAEPAFWSDAGRAWRLTQTIELPRYLRRASAQSWEHWRHGRWQALDLRLPACHLSAFEAEAWCRWAGRRLPTEAEWERAATLLPEAFRWGDVWEWTASTFLPYPGFTPHPYRDYSAPWFGDRPVLRGASFMTQPRMRSPRYRNFFHPHRTDLAAGFRTCAT